MPSKFFTSSQPKSQKFELAGSNANKFIESRIETFMDELEHAMKDEKTSEYTWSKDKAREVMGRQLALAYAFGFLDKTENRS